MSVGRPFSSSSVSAPFGGGGAAAVIGSATFTGVQQDNWAGRGSSTIVKLTASTATDWTGMVAGNEGDQVLVVNEGGSNVNVYGLNPNSLAANQFVFDNGITFYTLVAGNALLATYLDGKWRAQILWSSQASRVTASVMSTNQPLQVGNQNIRSGAVAPNGSVVGNVGDYYVNTAGAPGAIFYVKTVGNGTNTTWTALA